MHEWHEVKFEALLPLLCALERSARDVGDENVEAAECRCSIGDEGLELLLIAHIDGAREHRDTLALELGSEFVNRLLIACTERDGRAFGREQLNCGPANAAGSAGHEGLLARNTKVHGVPFRGVRSAPCGPAGYVTSIALR